MAAQQHFPLSYVDFLPVCLKKQGMASLPKFERFDVLIKRANEWLAANLHIKVTLCESLELPWQAANTDQTISMGDNDTSTYYERGAANMYLRALRMWIASKGPGDSPDPIRLGYYNVVPACIKSGGMFSMPEFDRFDATVSKVNDMFKQNPLQGRIINIETQDMKFQNWGGGVDPDESFWYEAGKAPTCFLNVLRIFYQGGPPAMEVIGCVDIVPEVSGKGLSIVGEPFSVISQRAQQWIVEHPGIRVTNLQSVNYKMDLSGWRARAMGVDTMRTLFYKSGKITTVFCRMIRINYVSSHESQSGVPPPLVTYRSFMPALVRPSGSSMMYNPKFETQTQNMGRLVAWLKHTGAKVQGVETLQMIIRYDGVDPECTITYDSGARVDLWLYMFRLYLDGHYQDPPQEMLPPPPPQEEPKSVGCCTLI